MQIRRATVEDAETIERIRVRGWQVGYRHVFPPEDLDAQAVDWSRWVQWFTSPPHGQVCFVAEDDDRILGWATVGASGFPDEFGELYAIYVDPDALVDRRRTRVDRGRAEERGSPTRYDDATAIRVLHDNPRARRFYERGRLGWADGPRRSSKERLGVAAAESCGTSNG